MKKEGAEANPHTLTDPLELQSGAELSSRCRQKTVGTPHSDLV